MSIHRQNSEQAEVQENKPIIEKSRTQNSMNNMVTGIASQAVTLILQFVYRTIFIQTLGITYLSVNGLFSNILTIFSFAELGIGQAIIFSLYKPIRENDFHAIKGLMALYKKTYYAIGFIIWGIGLAFLPFLPMLLKGSAEGIDHLYLIYILFVFESGVSYFFSYRQSYLTACQQQYYLNVYNCIFSVLREGLRIAIILITKQYIPVLLFGCAWTVLQNFVFSALIVRKHPYIKNVKGANVAPEEKTKIVKNIRALIIYKIGTLALNSTDNIIITAVVGLTWVGLYSNYAILVSSVSTFITILFSSLTASIGNLNAGDDMEKKKLMFNVVNMATFWIYSISSVCFMIALTPTVELWLGSSYTIDFSTVIVIAANIYVAGMLYTPFNYRQTMGLFIYGKWRPVFSAVINVVVSIWLGQRLGLKGVLLGTIISRLTTNGWFDPFIVYKKGFNQNPMEYFIKYLAYGGLLALSAVIGLGISKIVVFGGLFDILLHCVLCFGILSLIYYILFRKTEAFMYLRNVGKSVLNKTVKRN